MGDDLPDYELGINVLKQALATLTATVQQATTVDVDVVSQTIANLTAVVSATALDIRALAASDIAHENIPYNLAYLANWTKVINAGAIETKDYDQDDDAWAAGQDFYVTTLIFWITGAGVTLPNTPFNRYYQGIEVFLEEVADTNDFIYYKTITGRDWHWRGAGSPWFYADTFILPRAHKVDDGGSIRVHVGNYTAQQLNAFHIRIGGFSL